LRELGSAENHRLRGSGHSPMVTSAGGRKATVLIP
jgi:hypothetical protein